MHAQTSTDLMNNNTHLYTSLLLPKIHK